MKKIALTRGKTALVDDADYERLNRLKWYALPTSYTYYAVRGIHKAKNKQRTEWMHRTILGLQESDSRECDHRDGNGLNNQQSNLRICTSTQNKQSSRKLTIGTSKYKGVYWHCHYRKWISRISINNKQIYLGSFNSEIDAARVYDKATLKNRGEFALTNEMMGLI